MDMLLKYQRTDGLIRGIFQSVVPSLLEAQIVEGDPDYAYVQLASALSAQVVQQEYYVQGGQLVAKAVLTLTAQPPSFVADGVSECAVTVAPFVPCTLLVDNSPQALTADDPTLVLTATVPHLFVMTLAPMAAYRAARLTVEAI